MKIATPVLPNGMVNAHFGRAKRIAIADVENGQITEWKEIDVPFAEEHDHHNGHHHDHGNHDHHHHHHGHHESMKNFMIENGVDIVLVEHAGPGMVRVFNDTDIKLIPVEIKGKAKDVVQSFVSNS